MATEADSITVESPGDDNIITLAGQPVRIRVENISDPKRYDGLL